MNQHSCAAKGAGHYGHQGYQAGHSRHLHGRSMQRASVNIYKTETSFEMLVFAPGRIKEQFKVELKGNELIVSYNPPEGFPKFEWVLREYSRGGFVRSFTLDETIDANAISAKYTDGVLQLSLPIVAGKERASQTIAVN